MRANLTFYSFICVRVRAQHGTEEVTSEEEEEEEMGEVEASSFLKWMISC